MDKWINRAFLAGLLALVLLVPLGTALWGWKDTTAYYENRTLAAAPEITARSLWTGEFAQEAESWYSDHVPGRATMLKLAAFVDLRVLPRPLVNETVVTGPVLLPEMSFDEHTPEEYEEKAAPIAQDYGALRRHIESLGRELYFIGLPEQRVYFQDAFPDYLNSHAREARAADEIFFSALEAQGIKCLDMREVYEEQGNPPEYYSAVDHHYTYSGAYCAYEAILDMLAREGWEVPVLTREDLTFQELPNPYIGSRNRKLYNLWPNQERALIAVQKEPVAFTRYDNGILSDTPLFVLPQAEYLPTTYSLYMGGDFGETVLQTNRPELPDVLIFGDSFTNALETLLYASFDETRILDLRHYGVKSLRAYIEEYQPDLVLSIQNDTFYYTTTGNGAVWTD